MSANETAAYVRCLDERADRDLAVVQKLARERVPVKIAGNHGNDGDTAPHKAFRVPVGQGQPGNGGDTVGRPFASDGTALPYFKLTAKGVNWYSVTKDSDGDTTSHADPVWVCSPLKVAALTRDTQGREWGRLLVFPDTDGHEHRWACPQSMHAGSGDELRAMLLREGLTISANPKTRRLLGEYIQQAQPEVRARCVTRTGWHGDVFALPRDTYGDREIEPVLFQGANFDGVTLGQSGGLQDWIDTVATPCAGNSRLVLAICVSFAAPCLGLVQAEGGGIHLRGPSSTGKSTALHVAASLCGPPERYTQTWRATDNGLEGTASLHSDLLLVLDELGQLDAKHAGQVAYLLANGQGKARSHRDGSLRAIATWRILFLSAGELGLGDLVTQSGGRVRAGQEVRVVDVSADTGAGLGVFDKLPAGMEPGLFADHLKAAAAKHYGTALPAFLRALTTNPGKSRAVLQALRADIVKRLTPPHASGQVRRVSDRFALIGAAGELATVWKLTSWATGEAERAAATCFRAWLDVRGTEGNAEPAAMLEQVRTFLATHGESRFTPWDNDGPRTVNRAGFRKDGADGPTYYVERGVFRGEICKGFDPRSVVDVLVGCQALVRGGDGRDTNKARLPDGRNARVYVMTPALWGDA